MQGVHPLFIALHIYNHICAYAPVYLALTPACTHKYLPITYIY